MTDEATAPAEAATDAKTWAERQRVEALLAWLGRAPSDLTIGTPDWSYTWEGERWYIEVTSASLRPADHFKAYRRRLAVDPRSPTVPSASGETDAGQPFATTTVYDLTFMLQAVGLALARKGPSSKRYGNEDHTYVLIDASGDEIETSYQAMQLAAALRLSRGYLYSRVFLWLAIKPWQRVFFELW